QEQSNVVFGGIMDYLWFPWGFPLNFNSDTNQTGLGTSIRTELISSEEYNCLEQRIAVIHTGIEHSSTDVNAVWLGQLLKCDGYRLHRDKLLLAYRFREGLRLRHWDQVLDSIDSYRKIRSTLCPEYMLGSEEIQDVAETVDCASFPLGAG